MNRRRTDCSPRFVLKGRTWVLAEPELDVVCARVLRRGLDMGPALVNGPQAFDLAGRHSSPPAAGEGALAPLNPVVSSGRVHVPAWGPAGDLREAA